MKSPSNHPFDRFGDLDFDRFRQMAQDDSLDPIEKVGFPISYRAGREAAIANQILLHVGPLEGKAGTLLDIGPGCSELPVFLIRAAAAAGWRVVLVDSAEVLERIPHFEHVEKHPGYFPETPELLARHCGAVDAIVVYSVLHYVFREGNLWRFLDACLTLLAPGGRLLLGDIPNISKRKRFFSSAAGAEFHRQFMATDESPVIRHAVLETGQIDDSVILSLLLRARTAGFDAYVVPQEPSLPMANRREDVLIVRP